MFRRISKLTAMAVVAFVAGAALLVATPNVAQAATATINDYRQTLPASVIDTMTPDERVRWMEGTRAGNVGTGGSITPVRSQPGPRANLIRGGGAGTALLIGGQLVSELSPATAGEWWRDSTCGVFDLTGCKTAERPSHIDEEEWDRCGSGGSDFLGTLNDFASWWLSAGTDCNEVREGWEVERSPDYDLGSPVGALPKAFPMTLTMTSPYYPTTKLEIGAPGWDSRTTGGTTNQIGYVYPMNVTAGAWSTANFYLYSRMVNRNGSQVTSQQQPVVYLSAKPAASSQAPQPWPAACQGYEVCYAPGLGALHSGQAALNGAWQLDRAWGQFHNPATVTFPLNPYQPVTGGGTAPPTGDLEEVNLVTTITTESGRTYSCHTKGFVESASWVPAPCNPTWAEPDEVITERIVEVVPVRENPTHVPYSNPSREVERTTVPQPVRDQQRENSECSTSTCYVEVMVQRPDGVWVACSKYPELCRDWKRTTETKPTAHPFRCEYNFKVVDLAECRHLARLFEPGALEGGTAYPDPSEEGQPGYHPSNPPGSQTSTTPSAATPPGAAVRDPEKPRQCFPTGWGVLNPFEWVYKPTMCALEDAFVPRQSFVNAQLGTLQTRMDGKLPMIVMSTVAGWEIAPMVGGCNGIAINLPTIGGMAMGNHRILDACSGPLASAASMASIVLGIVTVIGCAVSITRSVGGIIAYNGITGS